MDEPKSVKYRSSRDPDVIYEATPESCTCPAGVHRGQCAHMAQLQRWRNMGLNFPAGIHDPPPEANAWKTEQI